MIKHTWTHPGYWLPFLGGPHTLHIQAFPPASKVPTVYNNNVYGAGSGALRVYTQTLNTFGADVNEVQQIVTRATTGQTIAGGFRLVMRGNRTALIKYSSPH